MHMGGTLNNKRQGYRRQSCTLEKKPMVEDSLELK